MSDITENAVTRSLGPVLRQGVSFLTSVVFHLLFGGYTFCIYSTLRQGHSWAPDPDATEVLFIGALIGLYLGGVGWISHHFFRYRMSLGRRLTTTIASGMLISGGLLTVLHYPKDWKTLGYYAVPGAALGIVTGLISASERNPWDLAIRGLGAKRREAKPLSLVGGVGLRLAGVVGLLYFMLLCAAFQKLFGLIHSRSDLLILLCVLVYLGLTILVAFVSPPRRIALLVGALLNVPLLLLIPRLDNNWVEPTIFITYAFTWAIFIAGRSVKPNRGAKTGTEQIRAPVWLGER